VEAILLTEDSKYTLLESILGLEGRPTCNHSDDSEGVGKEGEEGYATKETYRWWVSKNIPR
jgi:hypothetical protein